MNQRNTKGKSQGKIPSQMNGYVLAEFHHESLHTTVASHADILRGSSRVPAREEWLRDVPVRTSAWEANTTGASRASRSSRFSKWRQPQSRLIISLLSNIDSSLKSGLFWTHIYYVHLDPSCGHKRIQYKVQSVTVVTEPWIILKPSGYSYGTCTPKCICYSYGMKSYWNLYEICKSLEISAH